MPNPPNEPSADDAANGGAQSPLSSFAGAPRTLQALILVLAIELAALVIAGGFAIFEVTRPKATIGADIFLALMAWGVAFLLYRSIHGLVRGERWARSPAMTWQLFQVVIAVTWLTTTIHVGGILLLALAAAGIVCLMTPTVVRETTVDSRRSED